MRKKHDLNFNLRKLKPDATLTINSNASCPISVPIYACSTYPTSHPNTDTLLCQRYGERRDTWVALAPDDQASERNKTAEAVAPRSQDCQNWSVLLLFPAEASPNALVWAGKVGLCVTWQNKWTKNASKKRKNRLHS